MDVEAAAEELYAGAPGEFVAARTRIAKQAKAEGDKQAAQEIAALRRPTQAAWAVNLLVRRAEGQVADLLLLGERMRQAQASLAGEQLRELTRQRQQVIAAMARQARRLAAQAGTPVSESVGEEVAATLTAALADPRAAVAVRTGRLVTALSYAGLGEVDLEGVVALAPRRAARQQQAGDDGAEDDGAGDGARELHAPATPVDARARARAAAEAERAAREEARRREEQRRELTRQADQARQRAGDLQDAADETRASSEQAAADADRARAQEKEWGGRARELAEQLREAEGRHRTAASWAQEAERAARSARRSAESAGRDADAAHAALRDLERRLAELDG